MLFKEQDSRKPDLYPWAKQFIDSMWEGHWTPNEFNFQSDVQDFKVKLSDQEKEIVTKCLSAVAQIEVGVKKFWAKIGDNLPHPSIYDLGFVMANIEVIHNIAYEKLLVTLGIEGVFEENLKLQIIEGRVTYLKKYTHKFHDDNKSQFIYSLILFTLFIENVSLFSQFYIINWFNRHQNILKDTSKQVSYTSREETIHALVGIKLVNVLREEYPELFDKELEDRIIHESEEAFIAESKIIDWMVGDFSRDGLDSLILKEFVKNRINESLVQIGYKKVFQVDEALVKKTKWFDEDVLGNNSTDFFHSRPVEYAKKTQVINEESIF